MVLMNRKERQKKASGIWGGDEQGGLWSWRKREVKKRLDMNETSRGEKIERRWIAVIDQQAVAAQIKKALLEGARK